jgi:hypothetical protein
MSAIHDKASDVFLGHHGELLLKQALEACEQNDAFAFAIVVHDANLDLSIAFFDDGGLKEVLAMFLQVVLFLFSQLRPC